MTDKREQCPEGAYRIRVKGILDECWSDWLGGLTITLQANGETVLEGPVRDQAALHGLLTKIRDMGVPLLSVRRIGPKTAGQHPCGPGAGADA